MKGHGWMVTAVWMAMTAVCFGGQERLMVVIFDYVGVNDGNLEAAIETSRANFQREGVETSWSVCHRAEGRREKCSLSAESSFITINLVPQMKSALAGIASSHFLGWSIRDSVADGRPIAYVFYNPVTASAEKAGRPSAWRWPG